MAKTIWGCVNGSDASVHSGIGFHVDHDSTGLYTVTYKESFDTPPAVVLTQNYPNWNEFGSSGGNTKDNAVLVASDAFHFKVKTGNNDGDAKDRNFTFIATDLNE
ncbi:MAG TPA: hypothetical protein VJT15_16245 [Pyrinomonadaceae bacterium]|nr:hypothetical protein [Pyrinomonadaceae bacterium]